MNIQIQHSNIELEGYYVRNLQFSAHPDSSDEADTLRLTKGFHVQLEKPIEFGEYQLNVSLQAAEHDSDPTRYRLVLGLSSDSSPDYQPPYKFSLSLVGFFRLIGVTIPKPTREPAIVQPSVAILYSAAREVLAAATARGPFPAMILPVFAISVGLSKTETAASRIAKKRPSKKVGRKK
jgi:hypothetical protein